MDSIFQSIKNKLKPLVQPTSMASTFKIPQAVASTTSTSTFPKTPTYPTPTGNSPLVTGVLAPIPKTTPTVAPTPVVPPKTSTGATINPATGGIVQNPVPPTPTYTPPVTPTATPTPIVSPYQENVSTAEKAYSEAGNMTQEEIDTQAQIDELTSATRLGILGKEGQGRGIPLTLVRGEQEKLEKQGLLLTEPLEAKLARLQAKRTSALETSKFALERADKALAESKKPATEGFTLGKDQTRYDAFGNVIASSSSGGATGQYVQGADPVTDAYADAVLSGKTKLENIPEEYRSSVAQAISGKSITPETSPYLSSIATQGKQAISGLLKIATENPGIFGRTAAIPMPDAMRSDAYRNYQAQLDYLKGNIIPAALTAMCEASKTGGAVGQVSDREGAWLASSLGALSMSQDPETVKQQLKLIDESMSRWLTAVNQSGNTSTGTGGVVKTTIGDINTNW